MIRRPLRHSLASALLLMVLAWSAQASATPITFTASGANAAGIQSSVDSFRAALGNPDNNTRGATFTTPGSGLTQAPISGGTVDIAPGVGGLQGSLSALNATYAAAFATFSPNRLFVPLDSTITDGTFSVPSTGGTVPATVNGVGVVFTDVDLAGSSSLQFFDTQGKSLGIFSAPCGSGTTCSSTNGTLSFLGVLFTSEQIARVRIINGNTPLGPDDNPAGGVDVVALDDFLFAEPRAVPAPAGLTLLGLGLVGVAACSWLRTGKV